MSDENLRRLCILANRVREGAREMQRQQKAFDNYLKFVYGDDAELPDDLVSSIYYAEGDAPSTDDFVVCMGAPNNKMKSDDGESAD